MSIHDRGHDDSVIRCTIVQYIILFDIKRHKIKLITL